MIDRVGIIGGAGAEGSYFADILQKSGLEVVISDINVEKARKLCAERGYLLLPSEELIKSSNLALFSLPIDVTLSEIQRLAPLAKEAIADLTSVKTKAMEAMLEHSNAEVEFFGVHAMYRPTISPWGQNVIMIPGRPEKGGKWFNDFKKIMEKKKANVSIIESAKYHDELSAVLQVLPHAITYAYLTFLNRSLGGIITNVHLDDLQKYSTLFSRLMMETTGRVVSDPKSGGMYGLIQAENPHTSVVYDGLIHVLTQMKKWVASKEGISSFATNHEELNRFLGWYAEAAAEKTDRLMGHPIGIEIYFENKIRTEINNVLKPFSPDIKKYKEYLDTARVPDGELTKIRRAFPLAEGVAHGAQGYKEGATAFYLRNICHPQHKNKKIRFSPSIPPGLEEIDLEKLESIDSNYERMQMFNKFLESLKRLKTINPSYERVQMFNRFDDPFLNIFDTWNRIEELSSLGHLVAYRTEK